MRPVKLQPVAHRVATWSADGTVLPGLNVVHAPGHTPGSAIVVISSGNDRAMLLGDVVHCAVELIEAAPDRVVWASDWPHPVSTTQPPNEADLVELLYRATHDDGERKRILVDNPAKLFGFAAS